MIETSGNITLRSGNSCPAALTITLHQGFKASEQETRRKSGDTADERSLQAFQEPFDALVQLLWVEVQQSHHDSDEGPEDAQ